VRPSALSSERDNDVGRTFCPAALFRAPGTDTALIARTDAMVQWWYGYVVCSRRVPEHSLLQVGLWTLRALGSYSHFRMAPPNRRLHEEGHQAAGCEAGRQKEHWRNRASGRIADPRDDILRDEAAKVAH
jgi:hypothetical protein